MNPTPLVECDLCHDEFPLARITMAFDGSLYCERCLRESNGTSPEDANEIPPVPDEVLAITHAHKIHGLAEHFPNEKTTRSVEEEKGTARQRVHQAGTELS